MLTNDHYHTLLLLSILLFIYLFIYLQIFREIDATKASNFRGTLFFVYVTVVARINYNQGV